MESNNDQGGESGSRVCGACECIVFCALFLDLAVWWNKLVTNYRHYFPIYTMQLTGTIAPSDPHINEEHLIWTSYVKIR